MKPIRVALSGSGFRLPAHVGALAAIEDAGYTVAQLAGTSGGSIVAALYAAGASTDELRELCLAMYWSPMMAPTPWSILGLRAWSSGKRMLDFLDEQTDGLTFADLDPDIDLRIIASDLAYEREFVFDRERTPDLKIALAARASASIPAVYEPVELDGHVLQDGGLCDNIPAKHLTVDDVPRLGIYLDSQDGPLGRGRCIWDLAPRIIDLMLASNEGAQMLFDEHVGARILHVPTGYASSFDRHMPRETRQRLYDDGYAATEQALRLLPGWA